MKLLFAVRNVAAHAREMEAATLPDPVFFLKPDSCIARGPDLLLPTDMGSIEHEAELAVEVARPLSRATPAEAAAAIGRVGVVLDLTARDLQARLKKEGLPWLESKGFDGACVLGPLINTRALPDLGAATVRLEVNEVERQRFNVRDYAVAPGDLLARASRSMRLVPGDILGCGTGAGVGPLRTGDELLAELVQAPSSRLVARVAQGPA